MADLIITPSTGKIEFIHQGGQAPRVESIILHQEDGLVFSGKISASSVTAPLNVINVTAGSSNVNYPFIFASSGETGAKSLLMDSAGGTYNPSTNTATIDVSGNSATTTLASNSSQLNGQVASYYTDINARLGYTPVNKAGDTVTGNLIINGNFAVNGSFTAFSASNVYISSSQLYIEDNILTLNAFSPYLRYAGVEMYDSGSGTLSSLLWDGEADYFFLTGSSVNGKIITGPDGQTNLSSNFVAKATAGNKLGNSIIYDNGTSVGIGTTTVNQKVSIYPGTTGGISLQDIDSETRSYFFIDNTNGIFSTGIRTANYYLDFDSSGGAQNAIRFYTGTSTIGTGTERMRIISTGNVGIGTNTPGARLEISSSTAASLLNVKGAGGNGILYVSGSGAVGIGTTSISDGARLTIAGETRIASSAAYFTHLNYLDGGNNIISSANGGSTIFRGSSNNITAMTILGSGNVGIGTSSPTSKLHVVETTATGSRIQLGSSSTNALMNTNLVNDFLILTAPFSAVPASVSNNNAKWGIKMGGGSIDSPNALEKSACIYAVSEEDIGAGGSGAGYNRKVGLALHTSPFDLPNVERVRINNLGNVGIGTSSPTQRLHVLTTGGSTTTPNIVATFQANTATTILAGGGTAIKFVGVSSGGNLQDYDQCMISSLGYVGNNQHGMQFWVKPNASTVLTVALTIDNNSAIVANSSVTAASFSGAGTGLTGTAASLSIGGTAATATTASYSLNTTLTTAATYPITSSWATNAVTALNGGVTSVSAGTGIGTSASTGAVTITNSSPNATHTGDVTGATALTIANDAVTTVKILNANVTNAKLANSSVTIGSTAVSLGGTVTTFAGLASVTSTAFVGALTGNVTGNVTGTAGSETFATVTGRGASTTTQISVGTTAGGSMYTGIKSGAGYSDAVSGATFKSITDHPTGGSYAFAAYFNGAPGTGTNSFFVAADGTGYFKGYVGIGTTAPQYPLDISGSNIRSFSTAGGAEPGFIADYPSSNGYGGFFIHVNNTRRWRIGSVGDTNVQPALNFWQEGTGSRMIITNTGNVGIGTTTVPSPLTVYNNSDVWHFRLGGASGELRMGGQTNSGSVIQSYTPGGTVRDLYLQRDGGNIGVGLNNPSSKIHIYENANRVTYITQNNNHTARFEAYGTATAIDTTASNGIFFRISGGDIVKFAADGNVGIGTSNATAKLESYYSSNAITFNYLATNLNGNSPIPVYGFDVTSGAETRSIKAGIGYERHETNGRGTMHFYNDSTNDTASLSGNRSSAGDIKMSINNVGNVGIGIVSPNAKLDVNGVIRGDAGANYPHSFTNTDAGNTHWTNRGERVLTSNGTNWTGDGRDPIIALVTSGNSNSLNIANSIGLTLHNESTTDNTFSPAILFSNKSNSNSYNTAYAAIIGRKTGQGVDANWSAGELHFYTMPVGAYINNIPAMMINSAGNVGIGTTGPVALLNIRASAPTGTGTVTTGTNVLIDSNTSNYITFRNTADNGTYAGLVFLDNNVGGYIAFGNAGATVGSDSMIYGAYQDHIFQNGYVNENLYNRTETMRIKQNGNVGIGTTNPTTLLHVVGVISGSSFSGAGTGLTGTAAGLSIGGTAATATNSTQLGGVAAASYVTLTGTQTLLNKTLSGSLIKVSNGQTITEYAGYVATPNDYPTCTEKARIYTIGTINASAVYNSFIEIEVYGSHRGYDTTSYYEYKRWVLLLGDKVSSNLVSCAGTAHQVGLWNGTDANGFNSSTAAGTVLRLVVLPRCGAGQEYVVKVRYANVDFTQGTFTYTNLLTNPSVPTIGNQTINISGNAATATTAANGGVTSISAGTGIGTSASTGAVTITNSSPNATHTGDVTGATALTIANDAVTTVKILNANVTNAKLANSSLTIGSTTVSLGATATTIAGLTSVTSTTFVGALTGNASTATNSTQLGGVVASKYIRNDSDGTAGDIFSLITITKSLTLTTSWIDTGIAGTNLSTGCYIISLYVENFAVGGGHYYETYTGMMSWYADGTNATDYDEIVLHKSGHAPNGVYINLRTRRQVSGAALKLQIISSVVTSGTSNYIFKFRRMI